MRQEIFKLVCEMDMDDIDTQLALQCAPIITDLKFSNLLIIPTGGKNRVEKLLQGTDISYYILLDEKDKTTMLLYKQMELQDYLSGSVQTQMMQKLGYRSVRLFDILPVFRARYAHYMQDSILFPHEMGLLLGYPAEDVAGFIKHKGENFLYNGYWKVYSNPLEKQKIFDRYEAARENLVELVSKGVHMENILGG